MRPKGFHHSEETKRKMAEGKKGAKNPRYGKYWGDKHPLLGKHLSEEWKKKISESQKRIGNKPPSALGRKLSEETKKKMSEKAIGRIISLEQREKISKKLKGRKIPNNIRRKISLALKGRPGVPCSEETKRKLREARLIQKINKKDSKIEQQIEAELKKRNIYYQKHIPLCNVTIVDFYLPQSRTVIYCDGNYWHSLPGRKDQDINQDVILTFNGFNVYRFTETEINKSPKRCVNRIFIRR